MFYGNEVNDTRKLFFSSWKKYRQKEPLSALENQLVRVILDHPEYHHVLESRTSHDEPYFPELGQTNPFLHLGLHLAIRDQVAMDRPVGIADVYTALIKQQPTALDAEHLLMERLAECLWTAQRQHMNPDEAAYLSACRQQVIGDF